MNKSVKNQKEPQKNLNDTTEALHYLNDALDSKDMEAFLLALKNVINSRYDDVSLFLKEAHISQSQFNQLFSKSGTKWLSDFQNILDVCGLGLILVPRKQ